MTKYTLIELDDPKHRETVILESNSNDTEREVNNTRILFGNKQYITGVFELDTSSQKIKDLSVGYGTNPPSKNRPKELWVIEIDGRYIVETYYRYSNTEKKAIEYYSDEYVWDESKVFKIDFPNMRVDEVDKDFYGQVADGIWESLKEDAEIGAKPRIDDDLYSSQIVDILYDIEDSEY